MDIDFSRVHKFKKEAIKELSNSKILKELTNEVWIFGSSINGASDKKHTAFSDIDIGIYPKDITDISSNDNNRITREVYNIVRKKYNCYYDIVWMIPEEMNEQKVLMNNINKGVY